LQSIGIKTPTPPFPLEKEGRVYALFSSAEHVHEIQETDESEYSEDAESDCDPAFHENNLNKDGY